MEWTSQPRPTSAAISASEVLALADDDGFGKGGFERGLVGVDGRGQREGLRALVLALAAIGVGIEVAHKCALNSSAHSRRVGQRFGVAFRQGKNQFANAARLDEADGGSGGVAHGVGVGLGLLAQADQQEALGGETFGSVQQN